MRGLLLLGVVGAVIYALLVLTHHALTDDKAQKTYAEQQSKPPADKHLSSWGAYLPAPAADQNPHVGTLQSTPSSPSQTDGAGRDSERHQLAASEDEPTSENGSAEPQPKSVEWIRVVLAVQTHSEASVSAPTVSYYRPGTDLQVVRREGIWIRVLDPQTQQHGWLLDEYVSSIAGQTPTQVVAESTAEAPTVTERASPKSNKRHRAAKHSAHGAVIGYADPWNARWARRADRRPRFGLFMFHPFARFGQGR